MFEQTITHRDILPDKGCQTSGLHPEVVGDGEKDRGKGGREGGKGRGARPPREGRGRVEEGKGGKAKGWRANPSDLVPKIKILNRRGHRPSRTPCENWGLRPPNPLELGRFAPGLCSGA